MAETLVVQLREQRGDSLNRLSIVPAPLTEMDCAGNFFHQKIAAKENPGDATVRRGNATRGGNADQFQVIRRAKRATCFRQTEQIFEEIPELAKVVALEHQPVG